MSVQAIRPCGLRTGGERPCRRPGRSRRPAGAAGRSDPAGATELGRPAGAPRLPPTVPGSPVSVSRGAHPPCRALAVAGEHPSCRQVTPGFPAGQWGVWGPAESLSPSCLATWFPSLHPVTSPSPAPQREPPTALPVLFSHCIRSHVTLMCYLHATLFFYYYYFKYCVHICFNVYVSCTDTGQGKEGLFFVFMWRPRGF